MRTTVFADGWAIGSAANIVVVTSKASATSAKFSPAKNERPIGSPWIRALRTPA
ncbi:hypothetical protein GCM10010428_50830 [Actinosynnema pretiosum subsp. pretiosum]